MKVGVSCTGKRAYRDFLTARRMARRTNDDRDAHVQPYRCRHCQSWHLGTANKMPKKPRLEAL